jgi:catechol 2,3-dioxygenase-like lactoylglutathione lyase family enzyme
MTRFLGIDHVDMRVPSLAAVERFYDALLPRLGLTRKGYANVAFGGAAWADADAGSYNAVEYHEEGVTGRAVQFFGVIEETNAAPSRGRIAFAVERDSLPGWEGTLREIGAREIERSDGDGYPALFFTDPVGTRLELCARGPAGAETT